MNHIEWTNTAFAELENLPEEIAFAIILCVDYLSEFPEMGASLVTRFKYL